MQGTARSVAIGTTLSLSLLLASVFTATSAAAQFAPSGAKSESRAIRPNRYLLTTGALTLGAAYVPSFVIAVTSDRPGDTWLYAPVLGPWADLVNREGCGASGGNCDNEGLYTFLLVTSGIAQVAGATAIVASFLVPEHRLDKAVAQKKPEVQIAPVRLSRDGYGVGVAGRF